MTALRASWADCAASNCRPGVRRGWRRRGRRPSRPADYGARTWRVLLCCEALAGEASHSPAREREVLGLHDIEMTRGLACPPGLDPHVVVRTWEERPRSSASMSSPMRFLAAWCTREVGDGGVTRGKGWHSAKRSPDQSPSPIHPSGMGDDAQGRAHHPKAFVRL